MSMSLRLNRSSEHLVNLLTPPYTKEYLSSLTRNALVHLAHTNGKINNEELRSSLLYDTTVVKAYLWTLLDDAATRCKVREYAIQCTRLQQRAYMVLTSTYYNALRHGELEGFVTALRSKDAYDVLVLPEHIVESTRHHVLRPYIQRTLQETPQLASFADVDALRGLIGQTGFDNAKKYIATKIETSVSQHILRHILPRVIRNILRSRHESSDEAGFRELFHTGDTEKTVHPSDVDRIRSTRAVFTSQMSTPAGITLPDEPTAAMMSLHLTCCSQATGDDAFAPFPSCGLGRNYQRLCTRLFKVLTGADLVTALHLSPDAWKARMKSQRRKKHRSQKRSLPGVFKIRDKHVISSIETDGVGVSIVLKVERRMPEHRPSYEPRTKKEREEYAKRRHEERMQELASLPNARRKALDPGRVNLYVLAEENVRQQPCDPPTYNKKTFSRSKLNKITGRIRNEEWMNARVNDNPAVSAAMSALAEAGGVKCHDEAAWSQYLLRRHDHRNVLDEEFLELDERCKRRMVMFRKRQKALAKAADDVVMDCVVEKRPCIVGYGTGWGGACAGKGERSVPVKGMYIALLQAFKRHRLQGGVVDVWEYNTTQKCHRCGEKLQVLYRPSLTARLQEDRDFRCCTQCIDQQRKFRNRDFNAAINILKCLQAMLCALPRPEYLCPLPRRPAKRARRS